MKAVGFGCDDGKGVCISISLTNIDRVQDK